MNRNTIISDGELSFCRRIYVAKGVLLCQEKERIFIKGIISGHRRFRAAQKAGLAVVPAFIRPVSRDEAAIMVVDSNLHREHLLPSEKAFAYKLKAEALNHQGKRTDLTSGQIVSKSDDRRTTAIIGEKSGESYKTVQRYIRLTKLIPDTLKMVDEQRIAFSVGVELSYFILLSLVA